MVHFIGIACQGKDIVFRFIIEYSSLRDFGRKVIIIALFWYEDFWKMIFWLVLKLEISYRVMISWRILVSFRGFFWRLYFRMGKYLNFHNSSSCLQILFNVNGKATMWHTPCYYFLFSYMCEQRPNFLYTCSWCEVWTTWSYSSLNLILVFLKIFLMWYG